MIDPGYQQQLKEMHNGNRFNRGRKTYGIVADFIKQYRPASLLDFGCAQGDLMAMIQELHPDMRLRGYDPGVDKYAHWKDRPVEVVISTDALEHVEPDQLPLTLQQINRVMTRAGCFRIACYPAKKDLPDGRNCHLVVQPPEWWRDQILSHMQVNIVKESISVVDKRHKWHWVFGHNYDVVVEKQ